MKLVPRVLFLFVVLLALSVRVATASPPRQQLLPPVPLDNLDFPQQSTPMDLQLQVYTLVDRSRVEWYRLQGWRKLAGRVAVGGGVSYAGVARQQRAEYGGGPAWVALSTHLGGEGALGFSIDVDGTLPLGDENLFPVASDASSIGLRLRGSAGRFAGGRAWLGWTARRVSPPPQNEPALDRPDSSWPSASSLMAAWHALGPRLGGAVSVRYDLAGAPESFWFEGELSWFPVADLGLKVGASASTGPAENRPMDWAWLFGVRWRPRPAAATTGIDSSGK